MTDQRTGPKLGVLAVADPRPDAAIRHWRPFSGSALGEIVERCNEQCSAAYREKGWAPEDTDALRQLIDLLPYGLAEVDRLTSQELASLRIIVLDAGALARLGAGAGKVVDRLKVLIPKLQPTRLLYATQVKSEEDAPSWAGAFASVPVIADSPEFISSDDQLAAFLSRFCELLQAVRMGMASSLGRSGGVFRTGPDRGDDTRGQTVDVANQLLDAALDEGLSVEQAARLGRAAGGLHDGSDIDLSDVSVPYALRNAAREIRAGRNTEDVGTLIDRTMRGDFFAHEVSIAGGEVRTPRLDDALFRPDAAEGDDDLPRGGRAEPPADHEEPSGGRAEGLEGGGVYRGGRDRSL